MEKEDWELVDQNWQRYTYLRDNGHTGFMQKAEQCDDFFAGEQWDEKDLELLREYRRPAITINKILSTVATVVGEQIKDRTDVVYRQFSEHATDEIANALTKVFMHISEHEDLQYKRSEVFVDGLITSRGFFDVRLSFDESARGQVSINTLNPKDVLIDADARDYDPEHWNDVIITRWMTVDDIELLYSKKAADELRAQAQNGYADYMIDAVADNRDRFGLERSVQPSEPSRADNTNMLRSIRVIERQHRELTRREYFVDIDTGDRNPVPSEWDEKQIESYLKENPQMSRQKELGKRIRWTVTAGNKVLHDDWSPYEFFTVVPYFPYFRRGTTVGAVENLIGVQELLNKVSSQELHVVNTAANSGWKVKAGSLQNMSTAELEEQGAKTGVVLELNDIGDAEKITPNHIPTGLDNISGKAEEHIDTISGVSAHMKGFAREDVSAEAITENKESSRTGITWAFDNLERTDKILARLVLHMVQSYYVEERLLRIQTGVPGNQQVEDVVVNEVDVDGSILKDLTLGKYSITVSSQPDQESYQDSQFDQAVRLRTEAGVDVPDSYIVAASRLEDKQELSEQLSREPSREQQELDQRQQKLELDEKEANITKTQSEAQLDAAKAERERVSLRKMAEETAKIRSETGGGDQDPEMVKMEHELQLKRERQEAELEMQREKMQQEMRIQREKMLMEMKIKAQGERQQSRQQQLEQLRHELEDE